MKKHLQLFSIILFISTSHYFVFAQAVKTSKNVKPSAEIKPTSTIISKVEKNNPFSKGTWNIANRTNISYTNDKLNPAGKQSDFTLVINPKYFFTNHVAVGIESRVNSSKESSLNSSFSSYYAYLTLTYGTVIANKLNVFAMLAAGPGHSKSSFTNGSSPTILVSKSFDINGTIGVPIVLQQGGLSYFTPFVKYDKYKNKPGNHDVDENSIAFGLKLETYFNASSWKQNANNKTDLSKNAYRKGESFLEYNGMSNFSSDKRKEHVGSTVYAPVKTSRFNLGAGYHYYFIDNVAGGINIDISSSKINNLGSAPQKDKQWVIQPTVTANLPVETTLHNLFLEAGYGFGSSNSSGLKRKVTDINIRTGYNIFFIKNVCLTPKIGYESEKLVTKNGSSIGAIAKSSGLAVELGIRAWLNNIW